MYNISSIICPAQCPVPTLWCGAGKRVQMPIKHQHRTQSTHRLRNDLHRVEWDVKLYYTIPYHTISEYTARSCISLQVQLQRNAIPSSI